MGVLSASHIAGAGSETDSPLMLWYDKPADKWVQALPVGNGRLGAMIFGQPAKERFQLNDITVWSGGPQPDADRKDACKSLPELRKLIRDGKYTEAEKFANAHFNGPEPYDASCQTLGDLTFEFQLPDGKLVQATIPSLTGGSARLRYGLVTRDVELAPGGTFD